MANLGALGSKITKGASKAAQAAEFSLEKVFDRISTILRSGEGKIAAEDISWVEKNAPNSNILKQAKAYNAGEDWTKLGPSASENRGMTRGQAKEVNRLKRADEADAELARQEQAGTAIDEKLAGERESRISELSNFRASEQGKFSQYKQEAIAGGMNAYDAGKAAQQRIDKNISDFAERTSPDLAAEAQYPTPPISSNAPPVSSADARLAEQNKKKMLVKTDKATIEEDKRAAAAQRNEQALKNMPGKKYSGWASTYKPDETIPSATEVITSNAAKPESEKLKTLQSEFSTTSTPSEAPAAAAPKAKTKKAGKPAAAEPVAPAAKAATPEVPAVDFKGKSLSEVDAMVQSNPDLKQAAISYAKTKEKASWQNWAKRTEEASTEVSPASLPSSKAPITSSGAGPSKLSKLQKTAAPELAAPATTQAPTPEIQTAVAASQKGKPRGTKMVTQQEATQTLTQEKAPTFVDEVTGNPVKEADAVNLKTELQTAQQKGPEAVSQFSSKLKALGLSFLGAGGYVLAIKENQRAKSSENVLVNNLISTANELNQGGEVTRQTVQPQKISGKDGGGAPTAQAVPGAKPAAAAKPSPVKVENPQDLQSFWTKIQEVAAPMSQLDAKSQERLKAQEDSLTQAIKDATTAYNQSIQTAKDDAQRREAIAAWGQIFETLGQSAIKYFAAREGKQLGQRIGSNLQLEKHDWSGDLDRSLKQLTLDMADAKERLGVAKEEVESGRKALSRERETLQEGANKRADIFLKAAMDERERAQTEASRAKMKAEDRAFEQQQNAAKFNQALQLKQMEIDSRLAVAKTKASGADKKQLDAAQQSYSKSGLLFDNWYDAKSKTKEIRQKEFANATANLGLTEQESNQLSSLALDKPGFFSSAENKASARAILQTAYNRQINNYTAKVSTTSETPGQTTQPPGTVKVEFEGFERDYKYLTPEKLAEAKARYGNKVKVVEN